MFDETKKFFFEHLKQIPVSIIDIESFKGLNDHIFVLIGYIGI